jgi:2-dehydro-3-deoxygalactonokinase
MPVRFMTSQYLLGDWGTTHLRLYLMEQGRVVDTREGTGIGSLRDSPVITLTTLITSWLGSSTHIDITLCGMGSSRNGLLELPYVKAPAKMADWAGHAHHMQTYSLNLLLATGMQCGDNDHGFDVMRGEETQIFGATQLATELLNGSHCLVLPGTHSKWTEVRDGSVVRFRTALTGELYALLRVHSTLLKAGADMSDEAEFDHGFTAGAARSEQIDDGLLSAIFQARTAQLLQGRSAAWASGFLSGLLIGYELATMSVSFATSGVVTLIGQTQLTALYQRVFAARGFSTRVLDGAACVLAGLQRLRELRSDSTTRAI